MFSQKSHAWMTHYEEVFVVETTVKRPKKLGIGIFFNDEDYGGCSTHLTMPGASH